MNNGIRTVEIKKDDQGAYRQVRIVFGPHHFVELHREEDGKVSFVLGATHHGFKADASEVSGELYRLIEEIRENHPEKQVD